MANRRPHFDISAAVIKQLGEELVTDEVTAIMELIKNSYDADADWVNVEINTKVNYSDDRIRYKDSEPGFISIRDNGFGMSEDDILNGWMRISLSSKKQFKLDGNVTPKGRTPLGEKGVGRLSTQRLGSRLEVFTGKYNVTTGNHVAFDWDEFDDETSLTDVAVHMNSYQKPQREKGTDLVIANLRDQNKWEGKSWDRFRGQISQMIFPFKKKRVFDVFLKLNGETFDLDELHSRVINNSVGRYKFSLRDNKINLSGYVKLSKLSGSNKKDDETFYNEHIDTDGGKDFFAYLTDSEVNKRYFLDKIRFSGKRNTFIVFNRTIGIDELEGAELIKGEDGSSALAHPGNFSGEVYDFFFKESTALESAFDSLSEFKQIVQNQVGIRIFRDGFGIKPYGIDGQDWLELSGGQTSGSSYYGLRPGNVIGYVSIGAKFNQNLKEKTDREGFVDNPYSNNFFAINSRVVRDINGILENIRRSYNLYKEQKKKETGDIKDVEDAFDKLRKTSVKATEFSKKAKQMAENLAKISIRLTNVTKESKRQGGSQESIDALKEISEILEGAQKLLEEVSSLLVDVKKLNTEVEYLKPLIENLEQQLSDFSELAGLGLTAEALSHELSNIVDRLNNETVGINRKIKDRTDVPVSVINIYVEYVRSALRSFRKQLSHLAPSLKYVRESKDDISVGKFFTELTDYYKERFGNEILLKTKVHGKDFKMRINKGKLIQIIDNMVINAEYWLKENKKRDKHFQPIIKLQSNEPFIRISDNGPGIDKSIEDRVFQPFATTKPRRIGRGLGLFIVQQLLESSGCTVSLLHQRNDSGRRNVFQLNMSNVIE